MDADQECTTCDWSKLLKYVCTGWAWSTVWRHLGRLQSFRQQSCFCVCDKVCGLHPLSERACSFYKSGQVASTPILCRHTSATCSIREVLHSWSTCLCQGVWSPPPCCARACAFLQTWASGFHSHPVQYTSATCSTRKFCTLCEISL